MANRPIIRESNVVDEEEKTHVCHPGAAFNRERVAGGWGWGVRAYSFCLVMSLYIKNAQYVCLLC